MTVKIEGSYPVISRKSTGLFSLDWAVASRGVSGFPLRTITELYGHPNVGKSTLAYYLAGMLSEGSIHLCDFEQADLDYVRKTMEHSGYKGTVKVSDVTDPKGRPTSHEEMLNEMAAALYNDDVSSCIVDSVGGIQPIAEREGDFGEAHMGKRAKLVAQVSRSLSNALRIKTTPSCAFVINHVHGIMGGRGHTTAGGDTLKFLAAVRIMMWTEKVWRINDESDSDVLGFQVKGQLEKLRYGGRGKTFKFYIVPGYGVHTGVSAMFDCFDYELAEQGTTVKVNGKSLGYIRKDFLTYAVDGRQRKFDVFRDKLAEQQKKMEREDVVRED